MGIGEEGKTYTGSAISSRRNRTLERGNLVAQVQRGKAVARRSDFTAWLYALLRDTEMTNLEGAVIERPAQYYLI